MNRIDWDRVAKLEQIIEEKFGKEATHQPRRNWTAEDEEEYMVQLEEFLEKLEAIEEKYNFKLTDKSYIKNRFDYNEKRMCDNCHKYSFDLKDEYYLIKYDCCFNCFIDYVEGREQRWLNGWRPKQED